MHPATRAHVLFRWIGGILVGFVGVASIQAPAQPRLFVIPEDGDPSAYPSGTTVLQAVAGNGGQVCVEFWASGEPTDAFGVQLKLEDPTGGGSGSISADCDSQFIDGQHPNYILGGSDSMSFQDCPPAMYGLVLRVPGTWVTIPTTGAYAAELCYDVSVDASGSFVINWTNPGIETYVLDTQEPAQPIPNATYDGLVIEIVPCTVETEDADCERDENVCTWKHCVGGVCQIDQIQYGDVDHNGTISIFDVFCILNGFGGDFSVCSFEDDDIQPCEGNGTIGIFDLFAVLNAFSGLDPCCATGACCTQGICADDVSEDECTTGGGIYQGGGTNCTWVECPAGACCTQGVCSDDQAQADCVGAGGIYQGDGSDCGSVECPRGACCTQGVCSNDRVEADCVTGGGVYQGDGSDCSTVTCPRGACCTGGFCSQDVVQADCLTGGGQYMGDDLTCGEVTCPVVDVIINEVRIDQIGSDDDEYFEIAGAPGTSLDGLTYLVIGDDSGGSSGVIEVVVNLTGQSVPPSGYFVAAESSFSLGTADMIANLNFENFDNVTHLLVAGFTGSDGDDLDTDDDCSLDATPWLGIVDQIAAIKEDNPPSTTECHYGPPTVGPDGAAVPRHVYRCPDMSSSWVYGLFSAGVDDTPGAANACGACCTLEVCEDDTTQAQCSDGDGWYVGDGTDCASVTCPPDVALNEIRTDQPPPENDEYFEIAGAAGTPLDGLTYVVIGDDVGGSNSGVIEAVIDLTGQSIPASGYFVAAESTFTLGTADMTTILDFENDDNVTHLLVFGFSGSVGQDLDTDDDCSLDVTPWLVATDVIALKKEDNPPSTTECHYGPPTVGPDGSSVPGHAYRCPDMSGPWRFGVFLTGVDDTPGAANSCQ